MPLEVTVETTGNATTMRLGGDLDITTADLLRSALDDAFTDTPDRLVLDMRELGYMSSAGLRCLARAHQLAGDTVRIELHGPQPEVADVIRLAGLDRVMTIVERLL